MLNKCKYFGNYFGVKSFQPTFAQQFGIIPIDSKKNNPNEMQNNR